MEVRRLRAGPARRPPAASVTVGSTLAIEPGSTTTEPLTLPPVSGRVVEALVDRRRRLGIVGEHHVVPGLVALLGAELLLELGEQVGVGGLAAAAGAEDRADEGGHRDHVVDGRRRLVDVVRLASRR